MKFQNTFLVNFQNVTQFSNSALKIVRNFLENSQEKYFEMS